MIVDSKTSYAALESAGMLDSVLQKYQTAATEWASVIQERATWLFFLLAVISMVWTFAQLMFHRSSFAEFFGEFIRFIMFMGFFLWLLRNGPAMALAIIRSLMTIGSQASGQEMLSPSGIVDIGFKVLSVATQSFDILSPFVSIGILIVSFVILVILALVGINMLLQLCAAWVLAYAGIFFLGFGGSRWTSDMAINYFKTVLGIGASIMTMTLLVGVGTGIINEAQAQMQAQPVKLEELGVLLVFSITLLLLVDKLPSMVAGIITGAGIGSMGVGGFSAGAAVGAAMTAAAAVSGAASVAKSAVSGAASVASAAAAGGTGMASAVKAARQSAAEGGGSTEGASRSLGDAMGAKPPLSEVAKTLGKGAVSMAQNGLQKNISSVREGFQNKVNDSLGGRLAANISGEKSASTEPASPEQELKK